MIFHVMLESDHFVPFRFDYLVSSKRSKIDGLERRRGQTIPQ